jgi:hypothetical protein
MLVSDAKKGVIGYTVARSVSAVNQLSSNTPLFIRDSTYLRKARSAGKEAKIIKIKTAASKSCLKMENADSGSFSAQTATSSKRDQTGRASLAALGMR